MSASDIDVQQLALNELDLNLVLATITRYCITDLGREHVLGLTPGTNAAAITTELARVQEAVNFVVTNTTVPFGRLADIRDYLAKARIENNYLSAPDILMVVEAMNTSRLVKRFMSERIEQTPYLNVLCEQLIDDRIVEKHIDDAIDDTGAVRDTASKELQSIRREIHSLSARLRARLQKIVKKFGEDEILQEDFVTQRDGRFVVPLRAENKRAVDGIIHGVSATGQTVFLEPAETYEMNNELSLLKGREQREIIKILTTLTAEIGSISHGIEGAFQVMTELDTVLARAHYAVDLGGLKPRIVKEPLVELRGVRHPVLKEQARQTRMKTGTEPEVVPLDVTLDGVTRGLLISGPNAGGKTVAMKTIGVSLAMAMSGIFPLGECTTSVHRLYAAIGDHQSINSNLSTFSSQIIRLRDVLSFCDQAALVLIDEICAGTDPAEGGALAAGILDSLIERGASFVVTTHQSSLKQYALTRPMITNASLAFDEEVLQPTFNFLYGVPGNSYAFDLARNVGLPSVVIERARGYLGDRHDELEESINAMQQFKRDAEELRTTAAQEATKAEALRKDYEERLDRLKKRRAEEVDKAKEEAQELLASANAAIENAIREVRENQRSAKEIKETFAKKKETILAKATGSQNVDEEAPSQEVIGIGDIVAIKGTSTQGSVITLDEKGNNATVDVNGMKFTVPLDQLERHAKKDSKASKEFRPRTFQARTDDMYVRPDPSMSLDLRGMRADEGLRALESFLDDAVMTNLPFASIIHGKGTGALRKVVVDYLASYHAISSYRHGEIHEGGDGVTIVEF